MSRPRPGQPKDDSAYEYSGGTEEETPTPVTPDTRTAILNVSLLPNGFDLPFTGEDKSKKYLLRKLTSTEEGGSWEFKETLVINSGFNITASEPNTVPSIAIRHNEVAFLTPQKNQDCSSLALVEPTAFADINSIDDGINDDDIMELTLAFSEESLQERILPDACQLVTTKKRKRDDNVDGPAPAVRIYVSQSTVVDVLCGRGELINRHLGNVAFHKEKEAVQRDYLQVGISRKKKTAIAKELVHIMRCKYGSRFLERDEERRLWYFADEERIVEKAKQVLREVFTPEMRKEKRERHMASKRQSNH